MSLPRNETGALQPLTNTSVVRPSPSCAQALPPLTGEAPAEPDEAPAEPDEAPAEPDEAPAEPGEAPPALGIPPVLVALPALPALPADEETSLEPQATVSAGMARHKCSRRHAAVIEAIRPMVTARRSGRQAASELTPPFAAERCALALHPARSEPSATLSAACDHRREAARYPVVASPSANSTACRTSARSDNTFRHWGRRRRAATRARVAE